MQGLGCFVFPLLMEGGWGSAVVMAMGLWPCTAQWTWLWGQGSPQEMLSIM